MKRRSSTGAGNGDRCIAELHLEANGIRHKGGNFQGGQSVFLLAGGAPSPFYRKRRRCEAESEATKGSAVRLCASVRGRQPIPYARIPFGARSPVAAGPLCRAGQPRADRCVQGDPYSLPVLLFHPPGRWLSLLFGSLAAGPVLGSAGLYRRAGKGPSWRLPF